jgi:hypothetical protein
VYRTLEPTSHTHAEHQPRLAVDPNHTIFECALHPRITSFPRHHTTYFEELRFVAHPSLCVASPAAGLQQMHSQAPTLGARLNRPSVLGGSVARGLDRGLTRFDLFQQSLSTSFERT